MAIINSKYLCYLTALLTLNPPLGTEHRNGMKKVPLISREKFSGAGKID